MYLNILAAHHYFNKQNTAKYIGIKSKLLDKNEALLQTGIFIFKRICLEQLHLWIDKNGCTLQSYNFSLSLGSPSRVSQAVSGRSSGP